MSFPDPENTRSGKESRCSDEMTLEYLIMWQQMLLCFIKVGGQTQNVIRAGIFKYVAQQ